MNFKILGGVVTYNPEIPRSKGNLKTLANQVDKLHVSDNGSKNIEDIEGVLNHYSDNIILCKKKENVGIAYILKSIMDYANKSRFNRILSVDQDSVLDSKLVDEYKKCIRNYSSDNIGMLTCLIKDRNFKDGSAGKQEGQLKEVSIYITFAAFTSAKSYFSTVDYGSNLFIDLVDTDIRPALKEKNFKIFRINHLGIYHETGHDENKKILWKDVIVHNLSASREHYMARNSIILQKKHPRLYPRKTMLGGLALNFLIITLFKNKKLKRLSNFSRGIKDGGR